MAEENGSAGGGNISAGGDRSAGGSKHGFLVAAAAVFTALFAPLAYIALQISPGVLGIVITCYAIVLVLSYCVQEAHRIMAEAPDVATRRRWLRPLVLASVLLYAVFFCLGAYGMWLVSRGH